MSTASAFPLSLKLCLMDLEVYFSVIATEEVSSNTTHIHAGDSSFIQLCSAQQSKHSLPQRAVTKQGVGRSEDVKSLIKWDNC